MPSCQRLLTFTLHLWPCAASAPFSQPNHSKTSGRLFMSFVTETPRDKAGMRLFLATNGQRKANKRVFSYGFDNQRGR